MGMGKRVVELFSDADLGQGLQVAELQGRGLLLDHLGRLGQLAGGLELALGVDDLGPPLALGLGLPGHGALHLLGQVDVLDLDRGDLDAPGVGAPRRGSLQLGVELLALGEQLVQLGLAAPTRRVVWASWLVAK